MKIRATTNYPEIGNRFYCVNDAQVLYQIISIEYKRVNLTCNDKSGYWTDTETYYNNINTKFWIKVK